MVRKLAALLALAAVCGGCGVATGGSSTPARPAHGPHVTGPRAGDTTGSSESPDRKRVERTLPTRPLGQLILDGYSAGSLAGQADAAYRRQGGSENLTIDRDSTAVSFHKLCDGDVDLVDSASQITASEQAQCDQNGITPVQIQVASDALVFATENETDVGADCLTLPQVRAIMRAGSPVGNWSQLGFDNVKLAVAGAGASNAQFSFFGQLLTGSSNLTSEDLRYDYHAEPSETAIRRFVIGSSKGGELAGAGLPKALAEITSTKDLIRGWEATERGAVTWMNSARHWDKTKQYAEALAKLGHARAELRTLERTLTRWRSDSAADRLAQRQALSVLGNLGVFEYGYYTLYEQQLRPLEISSQTTPEDCSFPSAQTITTGDYPLSRRMLITFSLQALKRNDGERQFLLSYLKNVNTLATDDELVPLPTDVLTKEENWLEGHTLTSGTRSTPQPAPAANAATSMSGTGSGSGDVTETTTDAASSFGSITTSGSTTSASDAVPQGDH